MLSYAYAEAFGEKIRALGERTRPRDLYDVVNLFWNIDARPSAAVLLDVLRQKCEYKQVEVPSMDSIAPHRSDLEGAWEPMLGHQLPALPVLERFWEVLPEFFRWLTTGVMVDVPVAYHLDHRESVVRERTLGLPLGIPSLSYIEVIRFAAANHLCVDIDYDPLRGSRGVRRVEPYSLRRTANGEIVLHVEKAGATGHRSYRVDRIRGAKITNETFVPRYLIELSLNYAMRAPTSARFPEKPL